MHQFLLQFLLSLPHPSVIIFILSQIIRLRQFLNCTASVILISSTSSPDGYLATHDSKESLILDAFLSTSFSLSLYTGSTFQTLLPHQYPEFPKHQYWGADKSLAQPGRKQDRKHVRNACDFNNIETRAVIKFFFCCKARRRRKFPTF